MRESSPSILKRSVVPRWIAVAIVFSVISAMGTLLSNDGEANMNGRSVTVTARPDPDVPERTAVTIKENSSGRFVVFSINEIGAVISDLENIRRRHLEP